jgi:hypothetical protein
MRVRAGPRRPCRRRRRPCCASPRTRDAQQPKLVAVEGLRLRFDPARRKIAHERALLRALGRRH